MDAIECFEARRSVRAYDPTPVPRHVVEDIVGCGRLAVTAIKGQPWL